MKYLLDTNVYLTALRSSSDRQRFETTFYPLLPATVLSAVVAYELSVDAAGRRTRELLQQFIAPMQSAGRVVAPAFDDWIAAAGVVSAIERREPSWRSKLPFLLNDVLIALSGRRVGATVITYNGDDFRLIRRHTSFALRVLSKGEQSRARS